MITTRRAVAISLGGFALAATFALAPGASAAAQPGLTVSGSATPVTSTADVAVNFRVTVAGGPADASMLTITSPASAPVNTSTITVDGAPAPSVTQTGRVTIVRLGKGATSVTGGQLADGPHTVAYVSPAKDVQRGDAVSATASAVEGAAPVSGSSGDVAIPLADLTLTEDDDFGPAGTRALGTGQDGLYFLDLSDNGSAVSSSSLTFTLPDHLALDPKFGVDTFSESDDSGNDNELNCSTSGNTVTCDDLGALSQSAPTAVVFAVVPDGSAPVGHTAAFSVTATPTSGDEASAKDNTFTGTVRYIGTSHLTLTFAASRTSVPVGQTVDIHVTVRNSGPQAAPNGFAFLGPIDSLTSDSSKSTHFRITHFTGKKFDPSAGGSSSGSGGGVVIVGGSRRAAAIAASMPNSDTAARAAFSRVLGAGRQNDAQQDAQPVIWQLGRIAPGHSVSATLTLKAVKVGKASAVGVAYAPNDPSIETCSSGDDEVPSHARCPFFDVVHLVAVAADHSASGSSDNPIANTGAPAGQLTLLGLLAAVVGVLLMRLSTLRRGRHRA